MSSKVMGEILLEFEEYPFGEDKVFQVRGFMKSNPALGHLSPDDVCMTCGQLGRST